MTTDISTALNERVLSWILDSDDPQAEADLATLVGAEDGAEHRLLLLIEELPRFLAYASPGTNALASAKARAESLLARVETQQIERLAPSNVISFDAARSKRRRAPIVVATLGILAAAAIILIASRPRGDSTNALVAEFSPRMSSVGVAGVDLDPLETGYRNALVMQAFASRDAALMAAARRLVWEREAPSAEAFLQKLAGEPCMAYLNQAERLRLCHFGLQLLALRRAIEDGSDNDQLKAFASPDAGELLAYAGAMLPGMGEAVAEARRGATEPNMIDRTQRAWLQIHRGLLQL